MGFDEWSNNKKIAVILVIVLAIIAVLGAVTILVVGEIARTTEPIVNTITENINNNIDDNNTRNRDNNTRNRNTSHGNVVEVAQGDYKVKIETTGNWASYITTDGQYSQDSDNGDATIDLGTVTSFSSITINQVGSGNMKVSILDSDDNVVTKKTNSINYGSITIVLRVK
ncbi:MAG: hypothetical protein FWE58_03860 [Methanobrevibacter sp.]|nr:hypothetical protein [Methanobrevibacter sp.]